MHTEHLQNVHPLRVLAGWGVAIAVTSGVVFLFLVLGLMGEENLPGTAWAATALAAGFLVGGWFTGFQTLEAPILHGVAIGLTSLLGWLVLNVVFVIGWGTEGWTELDATATLGILLVQIVAAVVGCWVGTRRARARASEVATSPGSGVRGRGSE